MFSGHADPLDNEGFNNNSNNSNNNNNNNNNNHIEWNM